MPAAETEYQAHLHGPWCDIQGHLPFLYQAVADRAGAVVIELGVRYGESTRALLAAAARCGGQVWSCDLHIPEVPGITWNDERWHFVPGDDLGQRALEHLPQQCDVLFLDAHCDHWTAAEVREHLLAELRAYAPRVRPGGIIMAHDTQWQPPATDLGAPGGGVALALDDWCAETGLSWQNRPGHYGLGVISIPARIINGG